MVGAGQLDVYVMIQEQTDPGGDRTLYADATHKDVTFTSTGTGFFYIQLVAG